MLNNKCKSRASCLSRATSYSTGRGGGRGRRPGRPGATQPKPLTFNNFLNCDLSIDAPVDSVSNALSAVRARGRHCRQRGCDRDGESAGAWTAWTRLGRHSDPPTNSNITTTTTWTRQRRRDRRVAR